mmetsp:Transcript_30067/g.39576  ORF Transcript_30067/g.39576 Transcript_30067/m.39576 type:complete len:165 (+) Transcript_30067:125-619(+)
MASFKECRSKIDDLLLQQTNRRSSNLLSSTIIEETEEDLEAEIKSLKEGGDNLGDSRSGSKKERTRIIFHGKTHDGDSVWSAGNHELKPSLQKKCGQKISDLHQNRIPQRRSYTHDFKQSEKEPLLSSVQRAKSWIHSCELMCTVVILLGIIVTIIHLVQSGGL